MKKDRRKNKTKIFVTVFFILILFFSYYFFVASPVIKTYCKAETRALTEKAINLAVSNVINRTLSYDALIDINYGTNGEIISFSANQYEINSISREIVKEAQTQIATLGKDGLNLKLGTLTGIPIFIGRGFNVNFKLVPVGAVSSKFDSEFDAVGINMSKHTLFLYVNTHVSIVMPIKTYDFYSTNQVMLAESIIVGKVPEVYLNGGSLGKSLNLVP